jgi:hypothetical protein
MFGILHKTKEGYYMLFDENKKWIGVMGDCDGKKLKLSKQNCDEIFGVIDVEELAYENTIDFVDVFDYNDGYGNISKFNNSHEIQEVYIKGFNKAMELNKDKLFTVEDMMQAIITTQVSGVIHNNEDRLELIQSLQQPTEIEVDIITESLQVMVHHGDMEFQDFPKLDKDGCLILKRKI